MLADAGTRPWLSRERVLAWSGGLLALELIVFAIFVAGTHGWIVPQGPSTTDFASFQAAGALAWDGHAALAYDRAAHLAAEEALTAPGIQYQFFFYPPVFMLLLAPLSRLPYLVSFVVFEAGTLALFLVAVRPLLAGRGRGWWLPVLAYPAVFWTLGLGQNSFLSAALFVTGLRLLERNEVVAGMCLGALCYKPHLGLLIPVALAAGRYVNAFLVAAATVSTLILASAYAFGIEPWFAFYDTATGGTGVFGTGRIDLTGIVTPFATATLLGAPPRVAIAVQAASALAMAAIVWRVWSRPGPVAPRAACLLGATLLAAPVLLLYDLMLAEAGLIWVFVARSSRRLTRNEIAMVVLVVVIPVACRWFGNATMVQTGPLAGLSLVVWSVWASRSAAASVVGD